MPATTAVATLNAMLGWLGSAAPSGALSGPPRSPKPAVSPAALDPDDGGAPHATAASEVANASAIFICVFMEGLLSSRRGGAACAVQGVCPELWSEVHAGARSPEWGTTRPVFLHLALAGAAVTL